MAGLTTHVLDTASGLPAQNVAVSLWSADGSQCLAEAVTNSDGRTDQPILAADQASDGFYELRFDAGAYLQAHGQDAPFFDVISIRFRYDSSRPHHHVPLLLSPFGYSTYRGS